MDITQRRASFHPGIVKKTKWMGFIEQEQEGEECRKVREASRNQIKQCLQAMSTRFVLFFLRAIRSLLRVLGREDTIRFILSKGHSNLCRTGLKDNHIRRDTDRK